MHAKQPQCMHASKQKAPHLANQLFAISHKKLTLFPSKSIHKSHKDGDNTKFIRKKSTLRL